MISTKFSRCKLSPIKKSTKPNIRVLNQDILLTVAKENSNNILLLNMANAYTPSGQNWQTGFHMGQEEYLYKNTNLRVPIDLYPIRDDEVIVTKNVSYQNKLFDVISCPALDMRNRQFGTSLSAGNFAIMYRKIDLIFRTAYSLGYDTLILSAFGCGGFCLPPESISKIFRTVIEEIMTISDLKSSKEVGIRNIIFAIKDIENHPKNNFNVFRQEFKNLI